jgi:hypothetical protein
MTGGSMELMVRYRLPDSDPLVNHDPCPGLSPVIHTIRASLDSSDDHSLRRDLPTRLFFPLPEEIPLWAVDLTIQLVYRGSLTRTGTEEVLEREAVCVGFKDISEPTPVDIANTSDFACMLDRCVPGFGPGQGDLSLGLGNPGTEVFGGLLLCRRLYRPVQLPAAEKRTACLCAVLSCRQPP